MTTREYGTIVNSPIVAGENTNDDIASAIGSEIRGTFQLFQDDAHRDDWANVYKSRLFKTVAYVESSGDDNEPAWFKWDGANEDGSDGKWSPLDILNIPGNSGLNLDDGSQQASGVTTINLKSMRLVPDTDNPSQVDIMPLIPVDSLMSDGSPTQYSGFARGFKLMAPMQAFEDPNSDETMIIELKPGTYELAKPPGYLAYLSNEVGIAGKADQTNGDQDGVLWFDDVVVPSGPFIQIDKVNKSIGIQEVDQLDPNLTGGTNFIVSYRVSLMGKAPTDGMVRIYLREPKEFGQPEQYIDDANGNPVVVERHYVAGDELGAISVTAIVNAKGLKTFTCHVVDNFTGDTLLIADRSEGQSGVMIQAVTNDGKTGDALQQYEIDTGIVITFNSHYFGPGIMSMAWYLQQDDVARLHPAGENVTLPDGMHVENLTPIISSNSDGVLTVKDDGSDIADFSIGKIFNTEQTVLLHDKKVTATVQVHNPDNAFNLAMVTWSDKADPFTSKIIAGRNNGSIVFASGWVQSDSQFIPKAVGEDHQAVSKVFTIPNDAVNVAFILYPGDAQQPNTLGLSRFEVDVDTPFTATILKTPKQLGVDHLIESQQYKELQQDNQNVAGVRYTLTDAQPDGSPMPVGKFVKGRADIILDTSFGTVQGSQVGSGEGALKFLASGDATINTQVSLSSDQAVGTSSVVSFWWSRVGPGNQLQKIVDSEMTVTVKGGTKNALHSMPVFTELFEVDDRIVLRSSADKVDGAFIASFSHDKPLVKIEIQFTELLDVGEYDDPMGDLNLQQFEQVYDAGKVVVKHVTNASSANIPILLPVDADLVVLSAVKKSGDVIRPVKSLDYSYTNGTLSVSFGETADVKITLGIYL